MAKGISIAIASDTKAFLQGVKNGVIDPLEDVNETLTDVATSSTKAGDELEKSMREAQTETADSRAEFDKLGDSIKAAGKTGGSFGGEVRHGTDDAREGMNDLRDEAGGTAREVGASFDGSIDSIAGGFQELAANAFAGFGPAGMVAGLAAAAGIGLIMKAGQDAADSVNETAEAVAELSKELLSLDGDVSQLDIASKIQEYGLEIKDSKEWIEFWQEAAVDNLGYVQEKSKEFGLSWKDTLRGMSGADSEAAGRVLTDLGTQIDAAKEKQDALRNAVDFGSEANNVAAAEVGTHLKALESFRGELEKNSGVTEDAIEKTKILKEVTDADTAALDKAAAATEKATAATERHDAAVSSINAAYDAAAADIEKFIKKESGLFDTGDYIKSMRRRKRELQNYQEDLATSKLSQSAKSFLTGQGEETAAAMLAGYQKASPKQKRALQKIWTEAGKENSGEYLKTSQAGLDAKDLKGPKVKTPSVDVGQLLRTTQSDIDRAGPLKITVETVDRNGKRIK